jgi:hypothetical protein
LSWLQSSADIRKNPVIELPFQPITGFWYPDDQFLTDIEYLKYIQYPDYI